MSIDDLSPVVIGDRLKFAREASGITQADAAAAVDLARTTIVAIEKGQRRIRTRELQKLARLYKTSANALLRSDTVQVDLIPRFRKLPSSSDNASDSAAQILEHLVKAEVELENTLGIMRTFEYPPERPLLDGNVQAQAEADAIELRQWLGLGLSPTRELVTLLELQLGVRVYTRKLDSKISGLFAYDENIGACMLLNAIHTRERRTQTASHELGHLISSRRTPEILQDNQPDRSREERYASAFGRSFLTPARAIKQHFQAVTAGASHITRRHIIILAHAFSVSREALVRRLEELGLTKQGTWDWFQANGGITNNQALQVLGDLTIPDAEAADAERATTLRVNTLASEAWRQGLLSEGQLASLLHLNRIELRELLDAVEADGSGSDGLPKLPN